MHGGCRALSKQYNDNPRVPPGASAAETSEFWAAAPPFLQSNNYRHDIRHPIRDGPTMAYFFSCGRFCATFTPYTRWILG